MNYPEQPEALADWLIAQAAQPDFTHIVAGVKEHLTLDVLNAIRQQSAAELQRNVPRALALSQVVDAVANVIDTPAAQALANWARGNAMNHLNRYQESDTCYQEAELYFTESDDLLSLAAIQVNRALVLRNLGEYPQALIRAAQAKETCAQVGEAADRYLGTLFLNSGWIYEEIGQPETALATYAQARGIFEQLGDEGRVAAVDLNTAHTLASTDRFQEAEQLLLQSKEVLTRAGRIQGVIRAELNLGRLAWRQGEYQRALRHLETAYAQFAAIPLPVEVAVTQMHRAFAYRGLLLVPEMLELATAAARVFRQNRMRRELSLCLSLQAFGYQELGELKTAANLLALTRRELYRQQAWWKLWLVDMDRAWLLLTLQRPAAARRIARRVERQLKSQQFPSLEARLQLTLAHCALAEGRLREGQQRAAQALALTQEYKLTEFRIQAHHLLAQIALQTGEEEAAWGHLQQAVEVSEQLRLLLSLDEFHLSFMRNKLALYADNTALTQTLMHTGRCSPAQLFYTINLAFAAPLPTSAAPAEAAVPDEHLASRLVELRRTWYWHHHRLSLSGSLAAPDQGMGNDAHQQTLHTVEMEMAELWRRAHIQTTAPAAFRAAVYQHDQQEALLIEVQQQLKPKEALLIYYVLHERLHVYLLTPDTPYVMAELADSSVVSHLLRRWRFYLQHMQTLPGTADHQAQKHLSSFYQLLIEPLRTHLAGFSSLYICLPPQWHDLPLPAFFDGHHYLIERFCLTYLSAPSALLRATERVKSFGQASDEPLQALVLGHSDGGRLPHTLSEINRVAASLPAHWQVQRLTEAEATLDAFRRVCGQTRLLHLATHAVYRPDNPLFSWFQLADGALTVTDLYDIHLGSQPLVVLSACETGQGQARGGGLLGMGRGFLSAGAAALVVSLWHIEDQATAVFMGDFYQQLYHAQLPVSQALQAAQVKAIGQKQASAQWAGFVFIAG